MRTMTIKEYVLEQLNERLAKEGKNVRIVSERPKPRLVADEGKVVELRPNEQA
jgi:hypothetical protein